MNIEQPRNKLFIAFFDGTFEIMLSTNCHIALMPTAGLPIWENFMEIVKISVTFAQKRDDIDVHFTIFALNLFLRIVNFYHCHVNSL